MEQSLSTNERRGDLSEMVIQLGFPTLFFTLNAADTRWEDLQNCMPSTTPLSQHATTTRRLKNIIENFHLITLYMHHRFTAFQEVLEKLLGARDF